MHRTLIAGFLAGGLLAGCSVAAQAPTVPSAAGTLTAQVSLDGYRTLELLSDISTVSCRVMQGGAEQRQELGLATIELGKFNFALAAGTASVTTEAWSAAGNAIGRADAVVGIRAGQVTLLRQVLQIGGENNSSRHPLTPLPIQ